MGVASTMYPMKALIIYDSVFGNSEKIAQIIHEVVKGSKVLQVNEVSVEDLQSLNLLIVGSPVHGGRPTAPVQDFLKSIPAKFLEGVNVAAYDTRFAPEDKGKGLRILVSPYRYAAEHIAKLLISKGGNLVTPPEGFIVNDKEGPLREGEIERAQQWAKKLIT